MAMGIYVDLCAWEFEGNGQELEMHAQGRSGIQVAESSPAFALLVDALRYRSKTGRWWLVQQNLSAKSSLFNELFIVPL